MKLNPFAAALAILVIASLGFPARALAGGTPEPSTTATAVAAPTEVDVSLTARVVTWTDNAATETGFEISYVVTGDQPFNATYPVGSNAERFNLPAAVPPFLCGHSLRVTVVAVSGSARSEAGVFSLASVCPPPEATAVAPPVAPRLPDTGSGGDGSAAKSQWLSFLSIAVGALGFGFVARAVQRKARRS